MPANIPKLLADAQHLVACIDAAARREGPGGVKVTPAEWAEIAKATLALAGDILGLVAKR